MKRYQIPMYGFYDYTGMACHFEAMAQKGWVLDKMGNFLWRFRKEEPRRLKFAITYFPEVTGFEPGRLTGNAHMRELCEQAGWVLAADPGKFQVYYNEDPDAVELETDPEVRLEVIDAAMRKTILPSYLILIGLSLLQIFSQLPRLNSGGSPFHGGLVDYISGTGWMMLPTWTALLLIYLSEVARYSLWRRRAQKRAEDGLMTPSPGSRWVQSLALLLLAAIVLSWLVTWQWWIGLLLVGMLALLALYYGLVGLLKRLNVPETWNRIGSAVIYALLATALMLTVVKVVVDGQRQSDRQDLPTYQYNGRTETYSSDPIPLTLQELGYTMDAYHSTWSDTRQTPLAVRTLYIHSPSRFQQELPGLKYLVADIRLPLLWEACVKDFLAEGCQTVDPTLWGADRAWRVENARGYDDSHQTWVLTRGRRLVYAQLPANLTAEQMAAAGEQLLAG